jgi:hypothetical protein
MSIRRLLKQYSEKAGWNENSKAYQSGWDNVFGNKTVGQA